MDKRRAYQIEYELKLDSFASMVGMSLDYATNKKKDRIKNIELNYNFGTIKESAVPMPVDIYFRKTINNGRAEEEEI